jgi:acyl-CoA synthetase (AMP-forming)/AMP-acid ligase II
MSELGLNGAIPSALMAQAARAYAGKIALRYGEQSWTFAQFDAAADHLASGLARQVAAGERVIILMANRPEYVLLQCAIERAGLVRVPVNARSTAHELGVILADCEPAVLFYDHAAADRVATAPGVGHLWCAQADGEAAQNGPCYRELGTAAVDRTLLDRAGIDDLNSINYTSGTSGRPKGAMLTHRNWAAVYRNMLIDRDIRSNDVLAHIGPMTHASGTYFVPWFLRGATSVIIEGSTVAGLLAAIPRHKVTVFTCVPTALTRIVNHPDLDHVDLSSLRTIGYGAEPIPRNTLEKALAKFGPILVNNYGQTEAMMTVTNLPASEIFVPASKEPRLACIGRPYTFVEVILRGKDCQPVPAGEIGEITIRSDHVMRGYWRRPEETAKALRDGWLWTGDLGRMDERGFITLTGRSKEMLISGGHNIYPQEIEAVLTSCPGVIEAAVVAQPDPDWGEIAVAFVSLAEDSNFSVEAIRSSVKPRLGIKTPKRIEIVPNLPKTTNGKVDKNRLRERLSALGGAA